MPGRSLSFLPHAVIHCWLLSLLYKCLILSMSFLECDVLAFTIIWSCGFVLRQCCSNLASFTAMTSYSSLSVLCFPIDSHLICYGVSCFTSYCSDSLIRFICIDVVYFSRFYDITCCISVWLELSCSTMMVFLLSSNSNSIFDFPLPWCAVGTLSWSLYNALSFTAIHIWRLCYNHTYLSFWLRFSTIVSNFTRIFPWLWCVAWCGQSMHLIIVFCPHARLILSGLRLAWLIHSRSFCVCLSATRRLASKCEIINLHSFTPEVDN